jgi:hypothetical protein
VGVNRPAVVAVGLARADTTPSEQPLEQLRYARLLGHGSNLGMLVLVISFAAATMGWLPPRVPMHELQALWHLPVDDFQRLAGAPGGWAWWGPMPHGDPAGLLGIVVLAGCSVPCLLALLPLYVRAGNRAFAVICIAEVAVLLLAASGVLTAVH